MSHLSVKPLGKDEQDLVDSLESLGISASNEGIQKTSPTTFANKTFIIGDGIIKLTVGSTAPTNPSVGDLWYDTN